jgi:hypothetical protein
MTFGSAGSPYRLAILLIRIESKFKGVYSANAISPETPAGGR